MRRTTVRIDDALLADAKAYAAQHHRSLNSVIEEALRDLLEQPGMADLPPAAFTTYGGGAGGPDVGELNAAELKELMYAEEDERYREGRWNAAG
jgi:hypothetical protein